MPVYNWHCTKCDMVYEDFMSMREREDNPPTHCPDCDPKALEEGTIRQVHFAGSLPKFRIPGEGAYYPNKLQ